MEGRETIIDATMHNAYPARDIVNKLRTLHRLQRGPTPKEESKEPPAESSMFAHAKRMQANLQDANVMLDRMIEDFDLRENVAAQVGGERQTRAVDREY